MVAFNLQFHSNIPGRPFGQTTTWSRPATSAGTCGTSPPPLMGDVAGLGFTGSGMPSGCHFYNSELFFYIWTWRSWRVWKLNAAYYPETLVKTADLDPKTNHLVCCHPHGILCFGAVVREYFFLFNWLKFNHTQGRLRCADSCGLSTFFPGILTRICTLQVG